MRAREFELIVAVLTRIYQQRREERDVADARLSSVGMRRSVHEALPAYLWGNGDSHFLFFICHHLELNSQ